MYRYSLHCANLFVSIYEKAQVTTQLPDSSSHVLDQSALYSSSCPLCCDALGNSSKARGTLVARARSIGTLQRRLPRSLCCGPGSIKNVRAALGGAEAG